MSIQNHVSSGVICQLVLQLYHRTINEGNIYHYRYQLLFTLLKSASDLHYGTPVGFFYRISAEKDVSFYYVLHDMNSSFVTYRISKGDDRLFLDGNDCEDDNNAAHISVYQTEVESWRKLLKVGNTNKLLVSFAWCHDDEL